LASDSGVLFGSSLSGVFPENTSKMTVPVQVNLAKLVSDGLLSSTLKYEIYRNSVNSALVEELAPIQINKPFEFLYVDPFDRAAQFSGLSALFSVSGLTSTQTAGQTFTATLTQIPGWLRGPYKELKGPLNSLLIPNYTVDKEGPFFGELEFSTPYPASTLVSKRSISAEALPNSIVPSKHSIAFRRTLYGSYLVEEIDVADNLGYQRSWSASSNAAWLVVSSSGGRGDKITISADTTGLTPGVTYAGEVTITSQGKSLIAGKIRVSTSLDNSIQTAQRQLANNVRIFAPHSGKRQTIELQGNSIITRDIATGAVISTSVMTNNAALNVPISMAHSSRTDDIIYSYEIAPLVAYMAVFPLTFSGDISTAPFAPGGYLGGAINRPLKSFESHSRDGVIGSYRSSLRIASSSTGSASFDITPEWLVDVSDEGRHALVLAKINKSSNPNTYSYENSLYFVEIHNSKSENGTDSFGKLVFQELGVSLFSENLETITNSKLLSGNRKFALSYSDRNGCFLGDTATMSISTTSVPISGNVVNVLAKRDGNWFCISDDAVGAPNVQELNQQGLLVRSFRLGPPGLSLTKDVAMSAGDEYLLALLTNQSLYGYNLFAPPSTLLGNAPTEKSAVLENARKVGKLWRRISN
jgi:hypothetical protein